MLNSVVQALKCPSCELQLKIGESIPSPSSLPDECEISENEIVLCKLFLSIDYSTDHVYVWWSPIPNSIVEEQSDLLELSLPLKQNQKSITKYQFDYKFKPNEAFYMGAVVYCHLSDLCIINETQNLVARLYSLKQILSKIRQELEPYVLRASTSPSTIKCFHSFSDRVIDCGDINGSACFIGARPMTTEIAAGCTGDHDQLFVSVSFHVANSQASKGTCGIHCNRDQCNTMKAHRKLIQIARKYILGSN
ncbi:unnamed protein product [Adineta ricciae]|uniref:Uncharacterized protein n=2 Tax=Adineta ricciae TaxID=249248 RepID=A0A815FTD5_ADIRI|nr:unnamed protein product [Adineta ricciae]